MLHVEVASVMRWLVLHMLRRVGIAIGSIVAAWLVVSLVGGILLPLFGVSFRPVDPATSTTGSVLVGLITVVLGGLIYRDILRRERRPSRYPEQ
jgi:hypothetical protein